MGNAAVEDIKCEGTSVFWSLPASKTDIRALGATRSHSCACGGWAGSSSALILPALCPACCLKAQWEWAGKRPAPPGAGRPLFPTAAGKFPSKSAVIATIRVAASQMALPLTTPSGAPAWGGHALRRGGAQYLGRSGVEVWRIQALARHSSGAILIYLDGCHTLAIGDIAAEAGAARSLAAVRSELRALQALVEQGRASSSSLQEVVASGSGELQVAVRPDELALPTPAASDATPLFVSSGSGKVHVVDPSHEGFTFCRWKWTASPAAAVSSERSGILCLRCSAHWGPFEDPESSNSSPSSSES